MSGLKRRPDCSWLDRQHLFTSGTMTTQAIGSKWPQLTTELGVTMLELQEVSKIYRNKVKAVDGVSFSMGTGVLGLLGHNGAGKTSLMQMVATLTKPSAGSIRFQGEDIARKPDVLRPRLGYLPQDFGVYDNLTARELLQYVAALKGVRDRERIQTMLELVNLH